MVIAETVSPWNSLEVMKLIVGILSPAALLLFGWWLNRHIKAFELLQWGNQKIIERRIAVFQELAPLLNDLFCYFCYLGNWKESTPYEVVKLKRRMDKIAYVNAPLFPPQFIELYNSFIDECYTTYSGWGEDAKLRTKKERRKQAVGESWDPSWDDCFAPEKEVKDPQVVRGAYSTFMAYFGRELGIGVQADAAPSGAPPKNVM